MAYRICPNCGQEQSIQVPGRIWPTEWACPNCGYTPPIVDGIPLLSPALADTATGFDPAFFDGLAAVEEKHFWFVARNTLIVNLLVRCFPNASSFLEIGCGTGIVLAAIARARQWDKLVGSELHPSGLATARKRLGPSAEFLQMDTRCITLVDAFDVIGAFDVLEHIEEDRSVLASVHRALKRGGGVILTVPQHPWLWSRSDDIGHHVRRYRRTELAEKVTAAGFRVLFSGSFMTALLPLMVASRLMSRPRGWRTPSKIEYAVESDSELTVPAPINALLRSILQIEVQATLAGLRLPIGGSRVIAAVRD
jgi:SAM-dependent methyltransferase